MNRRGFLTAISIAGLAGCSSVQDSIKSIQVPDGGGDAGSLSGKQFGFGSPGFDRIEWINLNQLRIYFKEDHSMDGFGIKHAYDETDDLDNFLILCEAPRFEGPVDYPLIDEIKSSDVTYPTREFDLVAQDGQFSNCGDQFQFNVVEDTLGTASFTIPKSISPRPNFKDLETYSRTTLPIHTD